jgi:hypothetical protein
MQPISLAMELLRSLPGDEREIREGIERPAVSMVSSLNFTVRYAPLNR